MRKFVAILKDKRKGELTQDLLNKHVEHLQKIKNESKLFICGPFKDNEKAIQILLCDTIEEAISMVESDPFIKDGYYATYDINELIEANEANNWLVSIPQTLENLTK